MQLKFTKTKDHRWNITSKNNKIVGASTEGYKNKADAVKNVQQIGKVISEYYPLPAPPAPTYPLTTIVIAIAGIMAGLAFGGAFIASGEKGIGIACLLGGGFNLWLYTLLFLKRK